MPCIVQVKGLIACVLFARLRLPSQAKKKSVLYVLLDLPACTEIAITDLLLVFGIALPTLDRRVIQFGARESVGAAVKSSCYKHLAVSQQRGRVLIAGDGEIAGFRPSATHRIIQSRTGEDGAPSVESSYYEYLAIRQQCRRV